MSSHAVMSCRPYVNTQGLVLTIQIPPLHDDHIPSNELLPCQRSILCSMTLQGKASLSGTAPCVPLGYLLNPLPHTLTHTHPHTLTPSHSQEGSHWVSFHFQKSRDELVWVTVTGKAAIFLTLCLHSADDELLRQHSNKPIRKPSENVSKGGTQCFGDNYFVKLLSFM